MPLDWDDGTLSIPPLPQTVLTLNLLRQSNVAPTVLAYQYVHGAFDYNKMPLHQWDVLSRSMMTVREEAHGQQIHYMDGTYRHPPNTINATTSMLKAQEAKGCQTQ
jgi:hypothetical protein